MIAAYRQDRPWTGEQVRPEEKEIPVHDAACPLCPGNQRVSGEYNPAYSDIFVFDNDHPCVAPDAPETLTPPSGIYRNQPCRGLARVVCYTPRHNQTLTLMEPHEIENLIETWQSQTAELAACPVCIRTLRGPESNASPYQCALGPGGRGLGRCPEVYPRQTG